MKQQTAVEFIKKQYYVYSQGVLCLQDFQQAFKIEKEQLNIARIDGISLANKGYGSKSTSSQTEISDEDIDREADKYSDAYDCPSKIRLCKHDIKAAFVNSIGWYREQLKSK